MAQIFSRGSNTLAKLSLVSGPLLGAAVLWLCLVYARSSFGTGAGEVRVQPVPFSHKHHVGELGIDCRYCHTAVEKSSYAGMPPTQTLHELPFADVGGQRHARTGPGQLPRRQIPALAAGEQPARLRLLRPQHSRSQGDRLHNLSSAHRRNAIDRSKANPLDGMVPGVSSQSGAESSAAKQYLQRPMGTAARSPGTRAQLAKRYQLRDTRFLTTCTVCHR